MGQVYEMPPAEQPIESRLSKSEVLEEMLAECKALIAEGKDPSNASVLVPMLDRYSKKFEAAKSTPGSNGRPFLSQDIVGGLMNTTRRAEIFNALRAEVEEEKRRHSESPDLSKAA